MIKKVLRLLAKAIVFFTFFPHSISSIEQQNRQVK